MGTKQLPTWEELETQERWATGLKAAGSFTKGLGQLEAGDAAKKSADFTALQLRQKAGQVVAASQLEAFGVQREADYTASRAIAMAGASGAGASDPTVVTLMANNAQEFAYRKMLALYHGNDQARTLNMEADVKQYEGEVAKRNASMAATGTMLSAFGGMYSRFGGGGPSAA